MNIDDVIQKALKMNLDINGKSKCQIIRMIQKAEGNQPCYGTKMFRCNNTNCLWRKNCQGLVNLIEVL